MEARDFEHIVSGRFEQFGSHAPAAVWEGIEAHLDSKKRRIGIIWWITSAFALVAVGLTLALQLSTSKAEHPNTMNAISHSSASETSNSENKTTESASVVQGSTSTTPEPLNHSAFQSASSNPKVSEVPANTNIETKEKNTSIVKDNKSSEQDDLTFEKLTTLSINTKQQIKGLDIPLSAPAYAVSMNPNRYCIGLEFGTFVNLSKLRTYKDYDWTAPTFSGSSNVTSSNFQRQFEVEAFFADAPRTGLYFSGRMLYARSQSETIADSVRWQSTRHYLGLGLGSNISIYSQRLKVIGFLNARWEYAIGSLLSPTPQPTNINPTSELYFSPSRFNQHLLSAEIGLKINYNLTNRWNLFGSVSYRNYFWQQEPNLSPVTRIPQLVKVGAGISWLLR